MIEILKIGVIILTAITSFVFGVVFILAVNVIAKKIRLKKLKNVKN